MKQFKVRFAKKSDKETVLKFCENTWTDLNDYIHLVWDEWLEDDRGKIFVVTTSDDIPIAIYRVSLLSKNESWWEGFRVDPNYRQQFLAIISLVEKHINRYLIENNINISRYCVWSNSSKTMEAYTSRRKKRKQIGNYAIYKSETIQASGDRIVKLNLDDFEIVYSLISKYNLYPASEENQIIYASIKNRWQELTKPKIKEALKLGKIWGLKEKETITNIAIASEPKIDKKQLWLGYISGKLETLSTFLIEVRKLATTQKKSSIVLFVPCQENVLKSFNTAGYDRIRQQELFLYQWENK